MKTGKVYLIGAGPGDLPQQCSVETTLAELPAARQAHDIGNPAIVINGDVVEIAASRSTNSAILEAQL